MPGTASRQLGERGARAGPGPSESRADGEATGHEITPLWRGSLLPLECEALPNQTTRFVGQSAGAGFATAAQPSGSKLPRHRGSPFGCQWVFSLKPAPNKSITRHQ
ncbi:hypothetical protein DJ564_27050 [Pseudomonas sp. 31-12]|nr:hypothetical protein DJ564_27050 [Pseudomonas sp. 31-12]